MEVRVGEVSREDTADLVRQGKECGLHCKVMKAFKAVVPQRLNLFGTRDQFCGRQFSMGWDWRKGLGMIQMHCIYCALYFCYYYIVIYNEIITQLTIMQNQWEP